MCVLIFSAVSQSASGQNQNVDAPLLPQPQRIPKAYESGVEANLTSALRTMKRVAGGNNRGRFSPLRFQNTDGVILRLKFHADKIRYTGKYKGKEIEKMFQKLTISLQNDDADPEEKKKKLEAYIDLNTEHLSENFFQNPPSTEIDYYFDFDTKRLSRHLSQKGDEELGEQYQSDHEDRPVGQRSASVLEEDPKVSQLFFTSHGQVKGLPDEFEFRVLGDKNSEAYYPVEVFVPGNISEKLYLKMDSLDRKLEAKDTKLIHVKNGFLTGPPDQPRLAEDVASGDYHSLERGKYSLIDGVSKRFSYRRIEDGKIFWRTVSPRDRELSKFQLASVPQEGVDREILYVDDDQLEKQFDIFRLVSFVPSDLNDFQTIEKNPVRAGAKLVEFAHDEKHVWAYELEDPYQILYKFDRKEYMNLAPEVDRDGKRKDELHESFDQLRNLSIEDYHSKIGQSSNTEMEEKRLGHSEKQNPSKSKKIDVSQRRFSGRHCQPSAKHRKKYEQSATYLTHPHLVEALIPVIEFAAKETGVHPAIIATSIDLESSFDPLKENEGEKSRMEEEHGGESAANEKLKLSSSNIWGKGLGQFGPAAAGEFDLSWYPPPKPSGPISTQLQNNKWNSGAYPSSMKKYLNAMKKPPFQNSVWNPEKAILAKAQYLQSVFRGAKFEMSEETANFFFHRRGVSEEEMLAERVRYLLATYNRGKMAVNSLKLFQKHHGRMPSSYGELWSERRASGESFKSTGEILNGEYINRGHVYAAAGLCGPIRKGSIFHTYYKLFEGRAK